MEDEKITNARYNFQKALRKFVKKYEEKGLKIGSIDINWEDETKYEPCEKCGIPRSRHPYHPDSDHDFESS